MSDDEKRSGGPEKTGPESASQSVGESLVLTLERLRLNHRNRDAWVSLYYTLWPYVVTLAYRRLGGDLHEAQDLAQSVFIRLLDIETLPTFLTPHGLYAYLRRAVSYEALNVLRARTRRMRTESKASWNEELGDIGLTHRISGEEADKIDLSEVELILLSPGKISPDRLSAAAESWLKTATAENGVLRSVMHELTSAERIVMFLAAEGLSLREIANATDTSYGAAAQRLSRARRRVAELLNDKMRS